MAMKEQVFPGLPTVPFFLGHLPFFKCLNDKTVKALIINIKKMYLQSSIKGFNHYQAK